MKMPSFAKSETGLQKVERLENEIENLELEISGSTTALENAASDAESGSADALTSVTKLTQRREDLSTLLAQKRTALKGAIRQNEKELSEKSERETKEKWESMAKLSLEALAKVEVSQKSLEVATKNYAEAMTLAKKVLAIIPQTDGTPTFDSLLADTRLVSLMKLELRRGGILLAHPWFEGDRDIPPITEGWIDGLGWAFKRAPSQVKKSGPWKKFFESGH